MILGCCLAGGGAFRKKLFYSGARERSRPFLSSPLSTSQRLPPKYICCRALVAPCNSPHRTRRIPIIAYGP